MNVLPWLCAVPHEAPLELVSSSVFCATEAACIAYAAFSIHRSWKRGLGLKLKMKTKSMQFHARHTTVVSTLIIIIQTFVSSSFAFSAAALLSTCHSFHVIFLSMMFSSLTSIYSFFFPTEISEITANANSST